MELCLTIVSVAVAVLLVCIGFERICHGISAYRNVSTEVEIQIENDDEDDDDDDGEAWKRA